ncbi:putative phosphomannomutase [Corynebacterium kalinowskii]|uniref:Phosphomannomutase n=1 Tax=Corynebacterium kalinowskii TaxID=2675216 RepID=A0A6B8VZJ7_9CORY|nr:phospho-sugar mutase [Corynebacterium kalinowskii]QGU02750.1 putative phosphomannomutase [Corynebacterium kalinowskii]
MSQPRELTFGTAGMRAPIGPAPDQMNVMQITRITAGLAAWLSQTIGQERNSHPHTPHMSLFSQEGPLRVVVGYDARYGSPNFAAAAAEVFAGAGFEVTLLPAPAPTQLIPWLIRSRGLDAGVQITASHNPAGYNGYKVYFSDGRQIHGPDERAIEDAIRLIDDPLQVPRVMVRPTTDQLRRYIDDVVDLIAPPQADLLRVNNERAALKVAYTAMHGVGGRSLTQALQAAGFAQIFPVPAQHYPDPLFPTVSFPNPEEPGATDLLLETAREYDADIMIALDPDADRCAVGYRRPDGSHVMLRGDDLGPLLAIRLAPRIEATKRPVVATSEVSSRLLSHIANDRGWDYRETCTGFKHLIRAADETSGTLAFAYEEAIGTAPAPDLVGDKDGIATALFACDWAAELKAQGLTFADELNSLYKRYGRFRGTQIAVRSSDPHGLIVALRSHTPDTLAGVPVTAEKLHCSEGVLFEGYGVRALARTSGTENKAKFYLEVHQPWEAENTEELLDQLKADVERLVERL